jgi:hypothetical protein
MVLVVKMMWELSGSVPEPERSGSPANSVYEPSVESGVAVWRHSYKHTIGAVRYGTYYMKITTVIVIVTVATALQ